MIAKFQSPCLHPVAKLRFAFCREQAGRINVRLRRQVCHHRLDLAVPSLDMERVFQRGLDLDALARGVFELKVYHVARGLGEDFSDLAPDFRPALLINGCHLVADGNVLDCDIALAGQDFGFAFKRIGVLREEVDIVAKTMGEAQRPLWLESLPAIFTVHKLFYYVVAASIMYWTWLLFKKSPNVTHTSRGTLFQMPQIRLFSTLLLGILITEVALGIGMSRFGIPPVLQPFHLLFGTLLFANAFTITALLYLKRKE